MASFIVICVIGLILMLSSKEPSVFFLGLIFLMIILFIFNKPFFMILLFILLIVIIFSVIYYFTEKDDKKNKSQSKEENKLYKYNTKKEQENQTYYEFSQVEATISEIQNTYIENEIKNEENNTEIISKIINDKIILEEYVYCCSSINDLKEVKTENLKIETVLLETINKIYNLYEYEIMKADSRIYNKTSYITHKFGKIDMIKQILKQCLHIQLDNLKEDNIFLNTIMKKIEYSFSVFCVSDIIREYNRNYAIITTNEKRENLYILIYFCSYIFASCLYEKANNTYSKAIENNYIIEYAQYIKLKKIDKEKIVEQKDSIVVFNIEKNKFENKNTNSKLDYLVKKANNVRLQLKANDKYGFFSDENKFNEIGKIELKKIIEIMINSLKYYNINLLENADIVVTNIINIFNKVNELQIYEKEKYQQKKKELEERKKQEYIKELKAQRERELLKIKEKKELEKLKKAEAKKEIENQKQKKIKELENESEKINNILNEIFDNISIFKMYNEKVLNIINNYNNKNEVTKYLIYVIKRMVYQLPKDFKKENLERINNKHSKINLLIEIGYNVEVDRQIFPRESQQRKNFLLLSIYNSAIDILEGIINYKEALKLKENQELYKMAISLKENTDNHDYIIDKIYTIYNKFYKNTFTKKISKYELDRIIKMLFEESDYEKYLQEFFEKNKYLVDKITMVDEKSILKCITYIEKIDSFENFYKGDSKSLSYLILSSFSHCNINEKNLILENMQKIYNKLEKDIEKKELLKEKERLLSGDFSKEIEMQKQEVEYSNIQNGYEFEEYVANLYKKLGYRIEEVTKKSGDQGADVIAYKDNVKYVIQVKFYSNPVGNKAVQEVVASIGMYKADKGIVVTNSTFTSSAVELANANNIELVDGEKIEEFKRIIIDNI